MKIRVFLSMLAMAPVVVAQAVNAQGNNPLNVLITADENGNGAITFGGGVAEPLPGVVTPSGLFYNMEGPPSLVLGDLLLWDAGGTVPVLSDVIRFSNPSPGVFGFYFYSGDNGGTLADTGLPSPLLPNTASITEGDSYTPDPNQPGYVAGYTVEYLLDSPEGGVPDGGMTAGLLALALGGMRSLRRFIC